MYLPAFSVKVFLAVFFEAYVLDLAHLVRRRDLRFVDHAVRGRSAAQKDRSRAPPRTHGSRCRHSSARTAPCQVRPSWRSLPPGGRTPTGRCSPWGYRPHVRSPRVPSPPQLSSTDNATATTARPNELISPPLLPCEAGTATHRIQHRPLAHLITGPKVPFEGRNGPANRKFDSKHSSDREVDTSTPASICRSALATSGKLSRCNCVGSGSYSTRDTASPTDDPWVWCHGVRPG